MIRLHSFLYIFFVFFFFQAEDGIRDAQESRGLGDVYKRQLMDRQAVLQEKIDYSDGWNIEHKLERAMDALRCPDGDARVNVLSGGERSRVALCRLLLQQPDILLLDEPTNHLDAESVQWLETTLKQYNGTVICITHDRYFLDNVAGWILELDRGEGIPWKGNYSSWLEQKAKRLESEEKGNVKRRKILERELEWVRMSPKARHAKSKARLGAYENLLNQDVKQKEDNLEIFIPNGPRLGDKVIEARSVTKSFEDKLLFEGLEFLSLIHISEPTRLLSISYAVFCLKKKTRDKSARTPSSSPPHSSQARTGRGSIR